MKTHKLHLETMNDGYYDCFRSVCDCGWESPTIRDDANNTDVTKSRVAFSGLRHYRQSVGDGKAIS